MLVEVEKVFACKILPHGELVALQRQHVDAGCKKGNPGHYEYVVRVYTSEAERDALAEEGS